MRTLNLALRHPLVRQLGSDVVRFRACAERQRSGGDADEVAGGRTGWPWMSGTLPRSCQAKPWWSFAGAVAEQLQRLLGTEAAAPVREALAAALDRLSG